MKDKQLILASASPRRKEILSNNGISFIIKTSDYEEQTFSLDPILTAKTFALGKAKSVFDKLDNKDSVVVLGADTVVYFNGQILGKAKNEDEAFCMLKSLSNNVHHVITAFAIIDNSKMFVGYDDSEVFFNHLSDQTINDYIKSGLYKGKAGAYGIQDRAFSLVKSYKGSLDNIIGLPLEKILPILSEFLNNVNKN